ncbi:MFS transporter [Rhizobium sp. P40RR-XXII]|uniref:MFS transporter n=1 Tax=unclassified Rhizobium TaxID=2613769 RepID=UPI00145722EF|nr:MULTISPECIES: MFS transporter [unclassified Rhizobium]NLR83783.1 MFS transporter [Rhizobium sp. P28RR-XV]NLS15572.1 MFS transporter [Rhizobium sp. P40RR-XXII]
MQSTDRPETRLATRLAFLVGGFALACWAPLVPFAKDRLGVDDGVLGMLLLCLGLGSVAAMLATGMLSARYGSKPIIIAGGLGLALILPTLAVAGTPFTLGLALAAFGACLGSLDVAMNIHAVEVEKGANRPLMSGFHALFSIGGFIGSLLVTLLLSIKAGPLAATLLSSAVMVVAMIVAWPRLLRTVPAEDAPLFVMPRGFVLLLAALAATTFLVEGAILDWSALLLTTQGQVDTSHGGLGYMLFAIAMTAGRLSGDAITARVGDRTVMLWGGIVAVAGFVILLLSPIAILAMSGFLLIGLGAANIVPVLFRKGGAQKAMPAGLAVAAITMTGYAGVLVGPAGVGFVADHIGLPGAFWGLALLLCVAPLCAGIVTRNREQGETDAHRSYRSMDA